MRQYLTPVRAFVMCVAALVCGGVVESSDSPGFEIIKESCVQKDDAKSGVILRCEMHGRVLDELGIDPGVVLSTWIPPGFHARHVAATAECGGVLQGGSPAARFFGQEAPSNSGELPSWLPHGCVLNARFEATVGGLITLRRIRLERQWPTQAFHYEWRAALAVAARFLVTEAGHLEAKAHANHERVFVHASQLPVFSPEPMMRGEDDERGMVLLYYPDINEKKDFWVESAKEMKRDLLQVERKHAKARRNFKKLRGSAGFDTRSALRELHDLAAGRGRADSPLAMALEELLPVLQGKNVGLYGPELVLVPGENAPELPAHAFALAARGLGLPTTIAAANDLRFGRFRPELHSTVQLTTLLVALPDEEAKGAWIFVLPGAAVPFGRIPWWLEGSAGVIAGEKKALVKLPLSAPESNAVAGQAQLAMGADGSIHARWTRRLAGLSSDGLWGRDLADPQAVEQLGPALCGGGGLRLANGSFETIEGNTVEGGALMIRCEAEEARAAIDDSVAVVTVPIVGPWLDPLPSVALGTRKYAQRLPCRYSSESVLAVTGPPGFLPGRTPEEVEVRSEFGTYSLQYETHDKTIRIRRRFQLDRRDIPADAYPAYQAFLNDIRAEELRSVAFAHPTK